MRLSDIRKDRASRADMSVESEESSFIRILFYKYRKLHACVGFVRMAGEREEVHDAVQLKLQAQRKLLRVDSRGSCVYDGRKAAP